MIFIPVFRPMPIVGYSAISKEDQARIQANREEILNLLMVNPQGLTMQEIAVKTNKEVRQISAILTVLTRHGQVESEFTNIGKLWRKKRNYEALDR